MKYYSLNGNAPVVDFTQATIAGIAPDKGLYFPASIPELPASFFSEFHSMSNAEIAFRVIEPYATTIKKEKLFNIVSETVDFPIPLVPVSERIHSLELFHGPTLAFKDVGARFMSRCLAEVHQNDKEVVVLVATSGDTGGAVAHGFYDVPGVKVVILYPQGKVSPVQELQLTTLGKNITALETAGDFDDCQAMVKQAFLDKDINEKIFLTSANSINIARWLPQQFYYFFALKQWMDNEPPVICVPSGNFGNLCAGVLAACSGLPVKQFIAACNVNDVVYRYFESGVYGARQTIATYSNAMDVGDPSNFRRLMAMLTDHDIRVTADRITDEQTFKCIGDVFKQYNYMLDPHGAVAWKSLENYFSKQTGKGFILETAHPVKFPKVVEKATGEKVPVPGSIQDMLKKKKVSIQIPAEYNRLKEFLAEL